LTEDAEDFTPPHEAGIQGQTSAAAAAASTSPSPPNPSHAANNKDPQPPLTEDAEDFTPPHEAGIQGQTSAAAAAASTSPSPANPSHAANNNDILCVCEQHPVKTYLADLHLKGESEVGHYLQSGHFLHKVCCSLPSCKKLFLPRIVVYFCKACEDAVEEGADVQVVAYHTKCKLIMDSEMASKLAMANGGKRSGRKRKVKVID
jgi:hypothetical protein